MPELVPLSGSERSELPAATPATTPLDQSQVITVTLLLRRRAEVPTALVTGPRRSPRPSWGNGTVPTRPTRRSSVTCSAGTG